MAGRRRGKKLQTPTLKIQSCTAAARDDDLVESWVAE
jgi:hypothetical protein